MNDSLEHLPELKRDDLGRLTETIRQMCGDVEMVVLYGSYARGDYKLEEDLAPDRKSGAASDYDVLVVTSEKDTAKNGHLWTDVDRRLGTLGLSASDRPRRAVSQEDSAQEALFLQRRVRRRHRAIRLGRLRPGDPRAANARGAKRGGRGAF